MHEEALRLFQLFARFEHALKKEGFVLGKVDDPAMPHWDGFASKLGKPFYQTAVQEKAAKVLFSHPPKQQVVDVGKTTRWKVKSPPKDAAQLLAAVRRVRNNLFHGEKLDPNDGRDQELMIAALATLWIARQRCADVPALANLVWRVPDNAWD